MYEAVIFDHDGVLVGATRREDMVAATRRAFATHDVDDPAPAHVEALAGGVAIEDLREVGDAYDVDPAALWETRDRLASAAQLASLQAGCKQPYDDVDAVRALSVPAAVVSSNQRPTLRFLLDRFDLADAFVGAYGRRPTLADLARKKPEPYFLSRALADLERARGDGPLAPGAVLMVGDSESDVRAAHAAGVDAAFIRRRHREEYDLGATPDHEVAGLREVASLVEGD